MLSTPWLEKLFVGYPQIKVKIFGGEVKTFGTLASSRSWATLQDLRSVRPTRGTTAGRSRETPWQALKGQNFWEHVVTLYATIKRALGCFDFVIPHRPR
jgi:hypothetical protein